jgi:CMP-N,N'-diacetyllegionaminic acid synthase
MNILITICARAGSKGIPGKNIKNLNGKPLLNYSIEIAKKFADKHNGFIALSTDSDDIIKIASECGLYTNYIRPDYLASDSAGKVDTLKDVLIYEEERNNISFDYLLDLDVTSPLRTLNDLENAFIKIKYNELANNLFSVSPANRNPYFNMVELRDDGYVDLVKKGLVIKSRQEAPKVYDMNASFYFYKRSFFDGDCDTVITNNTLVYEMHNICFDLDHQHDFLLMELLLKENLFEF